MCCIPRSTACRASPPWPSASRLGPTTRSIARAAKARRIPVERADEHSLLRLGHGRRQRSVRASITDATPHIAVLAAGDKGLTKRMLRDAGIPVPNGVVVKSAGQVLRAARHLQRPLVVKPLAGNHGRGVSMDVHTDDELLAAYEAAGTPAVVVEEQASGADHRVLVIGGRVVAVAERRPPEVVGDGVLTIEELVEQVNADPRRGMSHETVLTRVKPDPRELERQGLATTTVPEPGRRARLAGTANLSRGGDAIDRTTVIHPEIAAARRARRERARAGHRRHRPARRGHHARARREPARGHRGQRGARVPHAPRPLRGHGARPGRAP